MTLTERQSGSHLICNQSLVVPAAIGGVRMSTMIVFDHDLMPYLQYAIARYLGIPGGGNPFVTDERSGTIDHFMPCVHFVI